MTDKSPKKPVRAALGRGLSALISGVPVPVAPHRPGGSNLARDLSDNDSQAQSANADAVTPQVSTNESTQNLGPVRYVPISSIENNPTQPRQDFSEQELEELSQSIKSLGVLQPVLVRPAPGKSGTYQVIAGERRWRAAKRSGLTELPVIIHEIDDKKTLEIALVENVQRSQLNPMEEALAYDRLVNEFSLSQAELAEAVGKERASVANILRLVKLPKEVQDFLRQGKITIGHAKAILSVKEPNAQVSLAKKTINDGLSVRDLEALVGRVIILDGVRTPPNSEKLSGSKDNSLVLAYPEVIDRLRNVLGTKVAIKHNKSGKGKIELEYFSEAELDRLVEQICKV